MNCPLCGKKMSNAKLKEYLERELDETEMKLTHIKLQLEFCEKNDL